MRKYDIHCGSADPSSQRESPLKATEICHAGFYRGKGGNTFPVSFTFLPQPTEEGNYFPSFSINLFLAPPYQADLTVIGPHFTSKQNDDRERWFTFREVRTLSSYTRTLLRPGQGQPLSAIAESSIFPVLPPTALTPAFYPCGCRIQGRAIPQARPSSQLPVLDPWPASGWTCSLLCMIHEWVEE